MDCSMPNSLSITSSKSLLKLTSIESVMPSNHLILCRPLLLPSSAFPRIRDFSNEESALPRDGLGNVGLQLQVPACLCGVWEVMELGHWVSHLPGVYTQMRMYTDGSLRAIPVSHCEQLGERSLGSCISHTQSRRNHPTDESESIERRRSAHTGKAPWSSSQPRGRSARHWADWPLSPSCTWSAGTELCLCTSTPGPSHGGPCKQVDLEWAILCETAGFNRTVS